MFVPKLCQLLPLNPGEGALALTPVAPPCLPVLHATLRVRR